MCDSSKIKGQTKRVYTSLTKQVGGGQNVVARSKKKVQGQGFRSGKKKPIMVD